MSCATKRTLRGMIASIALSLVMIPFSTATYAAAVDLKQNPVGNISATRFTDNGNGSITDSRSGLVWLKNADCLGRDSWSDALSAAESLSSGSCGLSDDSRKGDWRLPTVNEFLTLTDYNLVDSAAWLNTVGFKNVSPRGHWTSTTYAGAVNSAWVVRMESGSTTYYLKFFSNQIWPIRNRVGTASK